MDRIKRLRRAENQRNALLEAVRQVDSLLDEITFEEGADVNAKGPEGNQPCTKQQYMDTSISYSY